MMMIQKLLALLLLATGAAALKQPAATPAALHIPRGGGTLGPLDKALALKLSKTATAAYVAGSASKYINKQTGGTDSQLSEFITGDLFQLHALITAIGCALFNLADGGFTDIDAIAAGALLALALKLKSDGISTSTLKNNLIQSVLAILLAFVAYVK